METNGLDEAPEHVNAFELGLVAALRAAKVVAYVVIDGDIAVGVQLAAQLAQGALRHERVAALDTVVRLPPEELVVQPVVGVEPAQVVGQLARTVLAGVDERVRRRQGGVVGAAEHHRHNAPLQQVEELFRDVVVTQRVLERQVELVVALDHVVAAVAGQVRRGVLLAAAHVAAAVDVDVDMFAQQRHVFLAARLRVAVRREPGH